MFVVSEITFDTVFNNFTNIIQIYILSGVTNNDLFIKKFKVN